MKVLQINSVCGVGSTGRIATDIYEILKSQGHDCKVVYGRGSANNIPINDTYRIGNDCDVNFHAMMTRITDKTGFYSRKSTTKLIEYIKEYNPDVIHLHNIHGYYINVEILFNYLKECGKKIIWTLHDCWSLTGHCSYFDFIGCNKWENQCEACPQKNEYPASYGIDNSTWNFNNKKQLFCGVPNMTIVTPSDWLKNIVEESFLKDYIVERIYNGVDLQKFNIKNLTDTQEGYIILGVASIWDKRKGFDDYIKLANMLPEDYKVMLVGLSEKQIAKLPSNIIGIKKTDSIEELAELYEQANIFVNCTYEETLGLVNIEALACGTPVITYNTGGSPECIDESCGIVVDKGNIGQMKETIINLCNAHCMQQSCIKRSRVFDKWDRYNDYIRIYEG